MSMERREPRATDGTNDPLRAVRGWKALVHDLFRLTVNLVEEGHASTGRLVTRSLAQVEPLREPTQAIDELRKLATRGTLDTIRGVHRVVEVLTDAALDVATVALPEVASESSEARMPMRSDAALLRLAGDAAIGFLNGAVGDHLK